MTQIQQTITVEVSKLISAPVEKVFKAWIDPALMSKWFYSGDVNAGMRFEQDVRVGGKYRIDSPTCEEGKGASMSGIYKEIVPNKKLVFTWTNSSQEFPANDTLVTVEFVAKGDSTEVIIKHTNFVAQATAERHNMGWTALIEKLAVLFA